MFLDKLKDKRENFRVINIINDSDNSFMFFRQRNTVEFKLKILLKLFGEFQPQKVAYISRQRWKCRVNA